MRTAIGFLLILLLTDRSTAQGDFETIRTAFSQHRQKTFAPQQAFDRKYEEQLDDLAKKAQDDANLPLVLEIREEKSRFRDEPADVKPDRIKDPQLTKLREIYVSQCQKLREERIKRWQSLYATYAKDIVKFRDEATKAGRIDDALEADKEIKRAEKELAAYTATKEGPVAVDPGSPDDAGKLALLAADITGEWQYHYNGRTWRRIFNPNGKVELWLEGSRDGAWLSDLHWQTERRGIVTGAWIYKGKKEVTRLKLKEGGKTMKWEGGPEMTKIDAKDFWRKN